MPDGHRTSRPKRAGEDLLIRTLEQAPFGVVLASPTLDGPCLYVNPAFTAMTGYAHEDVPTVRHWLERAYPDEAYRARILANWSKDVDPANMGRDVVYGVTCKDGSLKSIQLRGALVDETTLLVMLLDVTGRVRAEEALQASEARFRSVVEQLPMGVHLYRLDEAGELRFVGANRAADQFLGLDHSQFVGLRMEEAFPGTEHTELPERYRAVCQTGEVWETEQIDYEDRRISGAFQVCAFQTSPGCMAAVFMDITGRVRTEQRLKARIEFEKTVARMSSRFLDVSDLDRAIEEALREIGDLKACRRVGLYLVGDAPLAPARTYEWREPVMGAAVEKLQPHELEAVPGWKQVLCEGTMLCVPDVSALPAGADRAFLTRQGLEAALAFPVSVAGRPAGVLSIGYAEATPGIEEDKGLLRLVSELVGTAVSRARAEEHLRASEQRFSNLFQHSYDGILIHDLKGGILDVNRRVLERFGYSRSELLRMNVADLHPEESLPASARAFEEIAARGEVRFEAMFRTKEGETFPAEVASSLFEVMGETLVHGIIRDTTERRRAEAERRRLEAQLHHSQKMEAIGELAGGIAHDFNNLLTAIQGNAELLAEGKVPSGDVAELAEQILRGGRRAADLTRQLLGVARKRMVRAAPVDVHEVIEAVVKLLRRGIDPRIEIVLRLEAAEAVVVGDASLLETALLNLGLNARDAMPDGGCLTIETRDRALGAADGPVRDRKLPAGDYLELGIRDTGVGMAPEIMDRIFEPFFTTKPQGVGTGLGLAGVYGCVEAHHGLVEVSSRPGQGASFCILLPRAEGARPVSAPPPAEDDGDERHASGTILLVDDESLVRQLTVRLLQRFGYEVVDAADGRTALDHFEAHHRDVDLVILDMIMPGLSGTDTFHALRRIDPGVRVLIVSGYSRNQAIDALIREGALGYIQKPYRIRELAAEVARCVGSARETA